MSKLTMFRLAGTYAKGSMEQAAYRLKHATHWERAFAGKNVFVVGAGAGLGAAVVRKIMTFEPTATIVVAGLPEDNDPNEPGLERIADECGTSPLVCNVTSSTEVDVTVARALDVFQERTGRSEIDFLIYVSGVANANSALEDDMTLSERMIDVNLRGYFRVLRAAGPAVIAAKGSVTIFSSLAARIPLPAMGCYAATKGAVLNLTESMEQEWRLKGVHFTTLIMSVIQSGMTAGGREEAAGRVIGKSIDKITMPQDKAINIIVPGIARRQRYVFVPRYMRLLCDWLPPALLRFYKGPSSVTAAPVMAAHRRERKHH